MIFFVIAFAGGLTLAWALLRKFTADKVLRRFWLRRLVTAIAMGIVVWRISPVLTRWEYYFDHPDRFFSLSPGLSGLFGGVFAYIGVILASYWAVGKSRPGVERRPLLWSAGAGTLMACLILGSAYAFAPGDGPGLSPSTSLQDLAGHNHRLDEWKGHYVVLNFWATWCDPCVAEIPELKNFAASAPSSFTLLGVNLLATEQGGLTSVLRFVSENHVGWTQLADVDGSFQSKWNVTAVPTTIVLDPAGKEIERVEGGVDSKWLNTLGNRFGR